MTIKMMTVLVLAAATVAASGCDESLKDVAGPSPTLTKAFSIGSSTGTFTSGVNVSLTATTPFKFA